MNIIQDRNFLNKISEECKDNEYEEIIQKLLEEVKNHRTAVGLAAPQIGILKRAFIMLSNPDQHNNNKKEWIKVVNPVVIEMYNDKDNNKFISEEGCLSVHKKYFKVERYRYVYAKDLINGEYQLQDLESIIFQHELDHINGILCVDKGKLFLNNNMLVSNKIGRNDLCFCDSGLKYKKCCGK